MYNRLISPPLSKSSKSILLLGPRQVGKSTLIRSFKPDIEINLAHEAEYFRFQTELDELERRIEGRNARTIFIDEIQRIPRLTNSIQALIDANPKLKFYLTGSSARKLRKGRANLLPGRILSYHMAPLCLEELGNDWNEDLALRFGFLPGVQNLTELKDKKKLLQSYSNQYLKEEILSEALVRHIDGFARFLAASAIEAGRFLDYSKLSKKSKVPRQSVVRHFEILEDTLIAQRIGNDPQLDPDRVDLVKHPKFFFFDLGVVNALRGTFETQDREGFLFEHLVFNQLLNSAKANDKEIEIFNFRTRGGLKIDFIVKVEGSYFAIECKSGTEVSSTELNPLRALSAYYPKIKKIVVYRGKRELKDDGIWIVPLKKSLSLMGLCR